MSHKVHSIYKLRTSSEKLKNKIIISTLKTILNCGVSRINNKYCLVTIYARSSSKKLKKYNNNFQH